MTTDEKRLTATLLRMASERFSNFGCNDFDLATVVPDPEVRDQIVHEAYVNNGDPEEYYENHDDRHHDYRMSDWWLMSEMADKLENS